MKVLFFVVFPEINAGSRYRVYKYLDYLKKENIEFIVCPPMSNSLFQKLYQTNNPVKKFLFYLVTYLVRLKQLTKVGNYDIIFIHQGLCYLGPPILEYLMAKLNNNLIYDVDDAHFVKPVFSTGIAARFHDRERIAKLANLSKHIIVSVDFIKSYVQKYNSNITIIPTSIDFERYALKSYEKKVNQSIIIGWAGSPSGFIYLQELEDVFKRLAKLYNVKLKIISSSPFDSYNIDVINCQWKLENEIEDLQSLDIGIMPLTDEEFERGKGGFKIIQYMGVGLPVICSPVGVNTEIIHDGVNGFLAKTKEDWFKKLSLLIIDNTVREELGRKARASIKDEFTIKANAPVFIQVLKSNFQK